MGPGNSRKFSAATEVDGQLLHTVLNSYGEGARSHWSEERGVVVVNESIVIEPADPGTAGHSGADDNARAPGLSAGVTFLVDLDTDESDDTRNLHLFIPRHVARSMQESSREPPPKKQRARKPRRGPRSGKLATIPAHAFPTHGIDAALLCADLRKREVPLAETWGPMIHVEPHGAITFCYGIKLLGDQVVRKPSHQNVALRLIALASGDDSLVEPEKYQANPLELLQAITRSPQDQERVPDFNIDGLKSQLLPYQRESLLWCLRKEGKDLVDGEIVDLDPSIRDFVSSPPLGWREIPNSGIWVNPYLLKTLSREPEVARLPENAQYEGRGLLAEEMGLGKTVELISLMLLNERPEITDDEASVPSPSPHEPPLLKSKATMIIVPRTILHQWNFEMKLHAPHLKTFIVQTPTPSIKELLEADVVLVTYGQLSRWLPYTQTIRKRERRSNRADMYIPDELDEDDSEGNGSRSTLIKVQFWRVILDEVQMVHTGSSAAAQVARRIQRVHAWAASGTPVKHSLEDLRGITYFLDLKPFVEPPCWQRLIASPIDFGHTMRQLAVRHTKDMVSKQLQLPPQHRRLILLKFSAIEAARYSRVYREFQKEAASSWCNWSTWLHRIRQACSHVVASTGNSSTTFGFGVGSGNATGDSEVTALTLGQILTQLIDDADSEVWTEKREKLTLQLQLGQLYDISYQMPKALAEWNAVVEQIKLELNVEEPRYKELTLETKQLHEAIRNLEEKMGTEPPDSDSSDDDEDDVKEAVQIKASDDENPPEEQDDAKVLADYRSKATVAGNRLKSTRLRCRSLQELLHRAYFFLGTGYFRSSKRLKLSLSPEELALEANQKTVRENYENETRYYNLAEDVRDDILNQASERVKELAAEPEPLNLMTVRKVCRIPKSEVVDNLGAFAVELAEKLRNILSEPLIEAASAPPPETEATKDEEKGKNSVDATAEDAYSKTLDLQEYAFAYLEMLQIILRDRATAIDGGNVQPRPVTTFESVNEQISTELLERREQLVELLQYERTPLTSLMRAAGVPNHTINELKLEPRRCQALYGVLGDLYNARVEYYKQLQDLSDQVTDIDVGTRTDYDQLILHKIREINKAEHTVAQLLKNQSYLRNLGGHQNEPALKNLADPDQKPALVGSSGSSGVGSSSDTGNGSTGNDISAGAGSAQESTGVESTKCTICLEVIETGALTACLHYFCEDCLLKWVNIRHSCPLCNKFVRPKDVQVFHSGEKPMNQDVIGATEDGSHASDLYSPISEKLYKKIYSIPTVHSYGIKIDMIVRHVKYLRSKDPTAQIVVFSQWGTMLKVLKQAFTENSLNAASTSNSRVDVNEFRTNPQVACLLLHAKADVAGLTLVNASHVFLCEPLMNTSLELQAVSRINRIGQTRETTVWQFCVENTVEQTILGLTTQSRLLYANGGAPSEEEPTDMTYPSQRADILDRKSGEEIVSDKNLIRRILIRDDE